MAAHVRGVENGSHEDFDFENLQIMGDWLIVLALAGHPVAAVLISFSRLASRATTVPYRVGVFSLATVLLLSVFPCPITWKTKQIALGVFHPLLVPAHI